MLIRISNQHYQDTVIVEKQACVGLEKSEGRVKNQKQWKPGMRQRAKIAQKFPRQLEEKVAFQKRITDMKKKINIGAVQIYFRS